MIREFKETDVEAVGSMMYAFCVEAGYARLFNPTKLEVLAQAEHLFVKSAGTFCYVAELHGEIVGFIGCAILSTWMSPRYQLCQELAWYLKPEARGKGGVGVKLLLAAEKRAKELGMKHIYCSHLAGSDDVGGMLKRLGYYNAESAMVKEL